MDKFLIENYPSTQEKNEIILRDQAKIYLFTLEDIPATPFKDHKDDVAVFAQMCALTYVDNLKRYKKTNTEELFQNAVTWNTNVLNDGWEPISLNKSIVEGGYNIKSLKIDYWVDHDNKRAVVAFRGTARWSDWWSNAHWLTRFVPFINDHYKQVQKLVPDIIEKFDAELGKDYSLYTTGHSLGGGLAQLFAYCSSHPVNFVCAFHTSPVTGYYGVNKATREQAKKGLYIARMFEHGEVLSYPRYFLRKFYKITTKDPRISEFRTNFIEGRGFITQHSISEFANCYLKLHK